jgi:anaerobic selenocysteine-containing dehydrogenase
MRQTKGRGAPSGWRRISWEEALDELAARLKALQDAGTPEKFMFHYGRMKASSSKIIKSYFLPAYGTKTIGNHTSICEGGKWTAQELTWGKHYDVNDLSRTRYILNFGCNFFEAHTSHVSIAQRGVDAVLNGAKMVTFDVRLSNTAAKSAEWVPIRPGTDGAVVLAMANVVMGEGLYDEDFIATWTNVSVDQLKVHLKGYTPEWAEGISGVPATKIRTLAREYATTKPSTVVSYRGVAAHYNGIEGERAIMMLEAICGNIDVPGGRCKAVGAKWKNSYPTPKGPQKKLKILDGEGLAFPTHHVNHQVLHMIKDGSHGRPDIYMMYCYNPAYVNGNVAENVAVLKDRSLIPYLVAVDPFMSESAALADLILPDATYLERWDWEDMVSYDQIPEYYIRQPMVRPLGEVRDFKDVCCDLARRLGGDVAAAMPFSSAEEFVRDACETTPDVKAAGGLAYMKEHGALVPPGAKPSYRSYAKEVKAADLEGAILDEETGVYWKGKAGESYRTTKDAYKKYVGQKIGDRVYKGFPPDKVNKSGLLEIDSPLLAAKGYAGMPSYMAIPEHEAMGADGVILTTFKVNVQTHSRTQNCKWLTEIFHDNPAWIHPDTAGARGISNGDAIRVKSDIGELVTKAHVTESIVPGVVAISFHCGHWAYGRYASGKKSNPLAGDDDPDLARITWSEHGNLPNRIIPNSPDPIGGQQRWMDTVVKVEKV